MNILWYFYLSVSAGAIDNADFIYVPSSVAAMIFFREFSITVVYFILNFICFGLVRYAHTIIKPIYHFRGQENLALSNFFTMFFMVFLIVNYFRSENSRQEGALEERNEKLHDEKERSDGLLLNILPAETAEELKATGKAKAKSFDMVTIMFTDFKNFTKASETMSPEELVSEINYCYSEFDRIVSDFKVEKIKTIGDGYMAAGGLPVENVSNPEDTIMAALEIRNFMMIEKQKRMGQDKPYFDIRIGIHTGPVVAGIVGIKKFAYDIWGDAVNTASRMESSGEIGKVNISGSTYELVRDKFTFDYRGKVLAKNKGEIDMYFVEA
jgi:adenylate cyclase